MMCGKVRKRLSLFLDRRLGEKERRKIRAHLGSCSRCAQEKDALSRTWEMLKEGKEIEVSPHFKAQFWERVAREKSKVGSEKRVSVFFPRLWRWSPALVIMTILLLGVGMYFKVLPGRRVSEEEMQIAGRLGLLEDLGVIQNLDWLDDFETIKQR